MKKLLPLLLSACAGLLVGALPAATPETVPTSGAAAAAPRFLRAGDAAPNFTVVGPKGETIKLSDFAGKVVIVDVSATWCGPCQAAMPNNDRVFRKYADQGVVLLGITADDSRAAYDGWIQRNAAKYQFTMAFDPAGREGWKDSIFNTGYRVTGFPTMFVIGRDGKILETVSGGGPGEDYRLEYALARAGVKVDLASIPPEPKKDPNAPKAIPAAGKTMAMTAPMMGGGMAPASGKGGFTPDKFGTVARGSAVTDFTVTGTAGQPVKLSGFRGKTLLLHFCTANGPQPWVAKVAAAYKDQPLTVLAIFSATEKADFDKWVAANPNPGFAVAWDPAGKAWAENVTNTVFGVGMYPASVVLNSEGQLWSGTIGMGDKVTATAYSMLARNGVRLTPEHLDALVAAGGAMRASGGGAPGAVAAATIQPKGPAGGLNAAPRVATLGAGAFAPDFVMHDVAGREVKLTDFKDKVVILDFWATWCGPCIASMPHTQKLAAAYKDQGVVVVASGTSDTIAKFKEWIPKNQSKYPDLQFYFDPNERGAATFEQRASARLYHVQGIPTQFVIGRDSRIVATIVGNGGEKDARTEAALAKAGIKVDAARAAEGEKQLLADLEQEKERAAAAAEELKNPKPQFRESYGKLKAGEPVSDFTAEDAAGKPVKFSEFTKGKTVVLSFWSAGNGIPDEALAFQDAWARKYAAQGVLFVGVGAYAGRADFDGWLKANAAKFSFPVLFDPAGAPPRPAKPFDELTDEEKKAFQEASRAHFPKVIPMAMTGGAMAPIPHNLIIDAQGRFLGFYVGAGSGTAESLGNLLLRAGVKLAPEDMPKKVFTAEESKEAPPEPRVEMLKPGTVAPDFTSQTLDGKDVKLSDYRGKVVILDFWATWCGPCMASMPHTQEVSAQYKDQGVVVLANCTSDTRKKFESWVKANQEKYPDIVWTHDPAERKPERVSRNLYGVGGIPTQFIIDREGKIVDIVIGYMKGEAILDAALAKAGVKVDPALIEKGAADLKKREMMR